MSIEDLPAPLQQSSWTDQLSFSEGVFDISSIPIRYFLTSVPLALLTRAFRLVEDIPGSEDWGYDAIFQRDIDEDRVKEELLNDYLLIADKFKFFNPLTIALLPYQTGERKILDSYRGEIAIDTQGRLTIERVDGIEITRASAAPVGNIRWDTDMIVATAIDGQHRLSALMKYAAAPPSGINPAKSQVPVILLLFNKERGDILGQVREIFVDINKTAKPVSKSREILLDDRDPFAILARDLIFDPHSNDDGLPYEVVDWRRESLKPDAPHQLTSLLVLYQCVGRVFSGRVRAMDAQLQFNEELRRQNMMEVDLSGPNCISSAKQSKVLQARFRPRHKQFILTVFRNVDPYKKFLSVLNASLTAANGHSLKEFLFKPESKRAAVRARLERATINPVAVIDEPINRLQQVKDEKNLLFFSIGQRGLFHWYTQIYGLYRNRLSTLDFTVIAKAYAEDLNFLNKAGFFLRTFAVDDHLVWEGICMQAGRLVASSSSAERIGALTLLAIASYRLPEGQTVERNAVVKLDTAFKRIRRAYEPIVASQAEEEAEGLEEIEEIEDDDEDTEDMLPLDRTYLAKERIEAILRWVKTQRPVS
jgi:DGQHR domain-containing protein